MKKNCAWDLTYGEDVRGDHALFIDQRHFIADWKVDEDAAQMVGSGATFFRLIANGVQKHAHGWVNNKGDIVQWG
jgi:hypothetical protein